MSDTASATESHLHSAYIDWKNWGSGFGQVDSGNKAYFARELNAAQPATGLTTVLEIGFGSGQFMGFCRERGLHVTGLEMNALLVTEAKKQGFDARAADDLFSLPDSSFDLIAAFDVVEHIGKVDIPAFFLALRRCLKEDGRILLRFPNGDSWLGRVNQNGDPTHQTEMGYFMLDYFARETGLKIISFSAPKSAGFSAGPVKGLHALIARPLAKLIAGILHLIYLPASPVVLSSSNVVAVLAKDIAGTSK
jgi:SAM-dependent methyltransferase